MQDIYMKYLSHAAMIEQNIFHSNREENKKLHELLVSISSSSRQNEKKYLNKLSLPIYKEFRNLILREIIHSCKNINYQDLKSIKTDLKLTPIELDILIICLLNQRSINYHTKDIFYKLVSNRKLIIAYLTVDLLDFRNPFQYISFNEIQYLLKFITNTKNNGRQKFFQDVIKHIDSFCYLSDKEKEIIKFDATAKLVIYNFIN